MSQTPIRPPFDPELVDTLEAIREAMGPITAERLPTIRATIREAKGVAPVDLTVGGAVLVEERTAPGPDGEPDITLLILRPAGDNDPLPGIYHVHGGGMVLGAKEDDVETFLPHVAAGRAVLVSVAYRLAPEHPDPAPVEDTYAGLVWTADHAAELGIDPDRLILTGISAGGGIAAGTALLARDRGGPALTHQILLCPMLDDRFATPSSRMLDGEGSWDRNDNAFGWTCLLGDRRGTDAVSHYAAPARCEDLTGLPRTYLDVGSTETFRDEVLDYARRLSEAGVTVDLHLWGGGFHAFDVVAPDAAVSRAAIATRNDFIERAFRR